MGNCRLCGMRSELQKSHVLPAFVFRWMRETSATGYLRFGHTVNLRAQDGEKRNWFCGSCETILGNWEKRFADQLFHPFVNGRTFAHDYGDWLLKFCVSISWRLLMLQREMDEFEDYDTRNLESLTRADIAWKKFLRGEKLDAEPFSHHLFLCAGVARAEEGIAPNINHYIMRSTDKDVVLIPGKHLVYGKIPRFFFFGVLWEDQSSDWVGTKIDSEGGTIPGSQYLPQELYGCANDRALRMRKLAGAMSNRQQAKIRADLETNPERFWESDTRTAIERDLSLPKPVKTTKK